MGLIKVAEKKDILSGKAIAVEFNGKRIALFNKSGQYYAIDDECPHAGAPLSEGEMEGEAVVCPWHAAKFDITNGQVLEEPAEEGVKSYKVVVDDEDIKIEE